MTSRFSQKIAEIHINLKILIVRHIFRTTRVIRITCNKQCWEKRNSNLKKKRKKREFYHFLKKRKNTLKIRWSDHNLFKLSHTGIDLKYNCTHLFALTFSTVYASLKGLKAIQNIMISDMSMLNLCFEVFIVYKSRCNIKTLGTLNFLEMNQRFLLQKRKTFLKNAKT